MRSNLHHIGKYELKSVLARTPMSTIYDGWDASIARRVAIKVMPLPIEANEEGQDLLTRFRRGAQAAGRLIHPNIVSVYDYGETDDFAFIVMEFVDGPTLKALLDEGQRFDLARICDVAGGILQALQYSHDHGVVHRDVKPANVMFTREGRVKLTDFGVARIENSEITQSGTVVGTPAYMSPEQFLGERVDWRVDIYATGVVLYQLLTGERPYEGSLATIMHKVLHTVPPEPSNLSRLATPALDRIVARAMAKRREDRFNSAAEFAAALQHAAKAPAPEPTSSRVPPPTARPFSSDRPRPSRSVRRTPMLAGFAGLAVLLLAAGGGGLGYFSQSSPERSMAQPTMRVADGGTVSASHSAGLADGLPAQTPQPVMALAPAAVSPSHNSPADASPGAMPTVSPAIASRPKPAETQVLPRPPQIADRDASTTVPVLPPPEPPPPPHQIRALPLPPTSEVRRDDRSHVSGRRSLTEQRLDALRLLINPTDSASPPNLRSGERAMRNHPMPGRSPEQPPKASAAPFALQEPSYQIAGNAAPSALLRHPDAPSGSSAEPGASPAPIYPSISTSPVGLLCQTVTDATAARFGLKSPQGMVVIGVLVGSAAEAAGLRQDDVILRINGTAVRDLSPLRALAAHAGSNGVLPVEILREGRRQVVRLPVDQLRH